MHVKLKIWGKQSVIIVLAAFRSALKYLDKRSVNFEMPFRFFNSSKNRTKDFCPSRIGQKLQFSSLFFERIEETKRTFQNKLTFSTHDVFVV